MTVEVDISWWVDVDSQDVENSVEMGDEVSISTTTVRVMVLTSVLTAPGIIEVVGTKISEQLVTFEMSVIGPHTV